jgi:hypothetical protein
MISQATCIQPHLQFRWLFRLFLLFVVIVVVVGGGGGGGGTGTDVVITVSVIDVYNDTICVIFQMWSVVILLACSHLGKSIEPFIGWGTATGQIVSPTDKVNMRMSKPLGRGLVFVTFLNYHIL